MTGTAGLVTNSSATPAEIQISARHNATYTYSGDIVDGQGAGKVSLTFTNAGTTSSGQVNIVAGNNTYSGNTMVGWGTFELGSTYAAQNSTIILAASGGLGTVANFNTSLFGFAGGIGAFTIGGLAGSQNFSLTDTNGSPITLSIGSNNGGTTYAGAMSGSGGITKVGSGTFTPSGANTYSGLTTVSAGTLALSSSQTAMTGAMTVNDGATLSVTVSGASQLAPSTLTLGYSSGGTVAFANVSSTAVAPVNPGTLTVHGTQTINITSLGNLTTGTYPLIANYGSGSFVLGTLPARVQATLSTSGGVVALVVTSITTDVWANASGGNWDTSTANWKTNGTSTIYTDGDPVQFDDSPGGSAIAVAIANATVSPASVLVNNSAVAYAIGGNPIAGSAALTKNGTNALTLAGTNTYTGGTTISAGTLQLGDGVSSNGVVAGNITDNASLIFANPNNQAYAGVISGSGTVTKLGAGTLTLSGSSAFSGNLTINAGTVSFSNTNGIGTGTVILGNAGAGANATLLLTASITATNPITVAAGAGAQTIAANNAASGTTFSGPLVLSNNVTFLQPNNGNLTVNGTFSGGGNVTLTNAGSGIAFFNGPASPAWTGNFILAAGTVRPAGTSPFNTNTVISIATNNNGNINFGGNYSITCAGVNDIAGAAGGSLGGGYGTPTLTVRGAGAYSYSGVFSGAGYLTVSLAPGGSQTLTGANTYTGNTTINGGTLKLTAGSLGNTAISCGGNATLGVQPGSTTTISAGSTGAGSAGATLSIGANNTFDMTDGAISTFNLQQESSFSGNALTVASGATFKFDLGNTTCDLMAVTGAASVSGTVQVILNTSTATSWNGTPTFSIITAASGLNGGTWQLSSSTATVNGIDYNLSINATATVVTVTATPFPVASFVIAPATIGSATAGTALTLTSITAVDSLGSTVPGFTGTVTFGGTAGVSGPSATFTAGVLTGPSVTPTTAGNNLTVTVNDGLGHTGSATITTVNPGVVSKLVINPATITTATVGTVLTLTDITAEDAYNNVCSSGPNVFTGTVTFGGTAGVSGNSAAFSAGVLASPSVTPRTAGSGLTITATSGSVVARTTITTVGQASTFVGASSSENPSGYQDSVCFQATLPSTATGSVVFSATNGAFSTNSLTLLNGTNAATSLSITNLPRGTNVITVAYLGDGNYFGSTNSLNQIVTNHPPVARMMTVTRMAGLRLLIPLFNLSTNWNDVDGDTVELTSVNMQSTNGVNLVALNWIANADGSIATTNANAYIGYTNSPNVNDQITYAIADGYGGTNIGCINVVIQTSVTGTNSITGITTGNTNVVSAYGIPGYNYILERSTNLSPAVWIDISTNTAATNGVINAADTFWDLGGVPPPSAFYQLKWEP